MECKRVFKWGLGPQTPGTFRFRARIPGPQERDRLTLAEFLAAESALGSHPCVALPSVSGGFSLSGARTFMARHLNPASLRPAQTTTIQCGEMGRTTLGLSSKSVNHVAGLKCQRCPRPGKTFRWTGTRAALSGPLHPSRRDLQPPSG